MAKKPNEVEGDLARLLMQAARNIPASPSDLSTEETKLEEKDYRDQELAHKIQELALKNRELEEKVNTLAENREARKDYTARVFWLIVGWLIVILALIIFNSFNLLDISDNVVLALVGSTTLNILGLFQVVLKYLYNPVVSKTKSDK